jgi:hypothetical protein
VILNNSTNINKSNNLLAPSLTKQKKGENTKIDVGNPGPGLRQSQKCGSVKPFNVITTFAS